MVRRIAPLLLSGLLAAGCSQKVSGPTPKVTGAAPGALCNDQLATTVTLTGDGLSPLHDRVLAGAQLELPQVRLQRMKDVAGQAITGEAALAIPDDLAHPELSDLKWVSQQELRVSICPPGTCSAAQPPSTDLAASPTPGLYALTLTNRSGAAVTFDAAVALVAPPQLDSVVPDLGCRDQDVPLTLGGDFLYRLDGQAGQVTVGDKSYTPTLDDCRDLPSPAGLKLEACKTGHLTVPAGTFAPGTVSVVYTGPGSLACHSTKAVTVTLTPSPTLASIEPAPICNAQGARTLTLTGTGFLKVNDQLPTVHVGTELFAADAVTDCESVSGPAETVQSCKTLTVTVPQARLAPNSYDVTVTNPAPADCSTSPAVPFLVHAPPTLASASPTTLCRGGGKLALTGTGLLSNATVQLGTLKASSVAANDAGTGAVANLGNALPIGGPYDVTYTNEDGCGATLQKQVNVVTGPITFFADPPVSWNGITTQITVYAANVQPPIVKVQLAAPGGAAAQDLQFTVDAAHPNRAKAVVPQGLAAGEYDVVLQDQSGCPAVLPSGLKVVSQTSFQIARVTPAFGYTGANTAIQVDGSAAFVATPRAYLTPSGGGTQPATALGSVSYVDQGSITAVVPKNVLAAGTYDLVVVNPDGTVGVLKNAFKESANPTPVITTLNPAVVNTQAGQTFQVVGQNLASNVQVSLSCVDIQGAPVTAPALAQGAQASCTVAGQQQQCIPITGTFGTAGVCVVSVTNPSDGSKFDFSSLVVQNPSLKLGDFRAAKPMTTARRGMALVAAQATPTARFVYAVGGDSGLESGALDTVEATTVDVFGRMGTWFPLPNRLATKRAFARAVGIGRFLYVVGGSDGAQGTRTVERAAVLDPTEVPEVSDLDIQPGNGQGLSAGTWVYRVAPIMSAGDKFNPGGEGLASDEFVVQAPDLSDKAQLTLTWKSFPGASAYRVYRSAEPNQGGANAVLVADGLTGTTFVDRGAEAILVDGQLKRPLPVGATGVFTSGPSLSTARSGAALTAIADPSQPSVTYVYAMAGNSGSEAAPTLQRSTEFLQVTTNADGSQTTGLAWVPGPQLATARWQAGGYALLAGGKNYVWAGAGRTAGGLSNVAEGAQVGLAGLPGAFTTLNKQMGSRAGYAAVAVNNFLFALGGSNGSPDTGGVQGSVLDQSDNLIAPEVQNFSNSSTLATARIHVGSTLQSGFLFVCGGQTTQPASNSCETTIW